MNKVFKAGVAVLVTSIMMMIQWRYFNTPNSGSILQLEFSKTYADAVNASADWNKGAVIFNTILDFAFLSAYGFFFYIANQRISKILPGRFGMAGIILKWFGPAAALFDVIENMMMLLFLTGPSGPEHFMAPFTWAVIKFALVLIAFIYFLIGSTKVIDASYKS